MADVLDLENTEDFEMDDDGDRKYHRMQLKNNKNMSILLPWTLI